MQRFLISLLCALALPAAASNKHCAQIISFPTEKVKVLDCNVAIGRIAQVTILRQGPRFTLVTLTTSGQRSAPRVVTEAERKSGQIVLSEEIGTIMALKRQPDGEWMTFIESERSKEIAPADCWIDEIGAGS